MSEPKTFRELLEQRMEDAQKREKIADLDKLENTAVYWFGRFHEAREILSLYDNWKGD